jgi:hypothetical protein
VVAEFAPLPSPPKVLSPQQYAAPLVVTPQVMPTPELTVVKLSGGPVFGGFGGELSDGEVIGGSSGLEHPTVTRASSTQTVNRSRCALCLRMANLLIDG